VAALDYLLVLVESTTVTVNNQFEAVSKLDTASFFVKFVRIPPLGAFSNF